jgi:hypothetical protein
MITPSDRDYKQTKLIKTGAKKLSPLFRELADWIAEQYRGVTVLNICYDKITPGNRPRLSIIFERAHDRQRFLASARGNYDPVAQAKVASKFTEMLADKPNSKFETDELFVIFGAFEPVARVEANWKVTREELSQLQTALDNPAIWLIRPSWDHVVFFFCTDAQLRTSEDADIRTLCADGYSKLLSQYDEFGYFREQPISVYFDSKENFDGKYQGNWFYYDR